ncbi:hypothetical protein Voja6_00166 [Pseudomonas phage vB_PpuM-Voja-6]
MNTGYFLMLAVYTALHNGYTPIQTFDGPIAKSDCWSAAIRLSIDERVSQVNELGKWDGEIYTQLIRKYKGTVPLILPVQAVDFVCHPQVRHPEYVK